jgi:hypothetical protein
MPFALGGLISVLEGTSDASPWPYLFGYVGLRFLQGSGGLPAVRDVSHNDFAASVRILTRFLSVLMGACHAILRQRYEIPGFWMSGYGSY